MRREFFELETFDTIEATQEALDIWVLGYNTEREHQSIGDVAPIKRFELAAGHKREPFEVIDGEVADEPAVPKVSSIGRVVDTAGRISVLTFRYHVGRHLAGCTVEVTNSAGLLHVSHNGVLVATHAKRHPDDDDVKFEGRPSATRPAAPTTGTEVMRTVDTTGSVSFAGTGYRVGNNYKGQSAGVRLVGDTVQITIEGRLVRTHRARHDRSKEFGALAQPNGKPRRSRNGVA
jgi:hypothetical protein